MVTFWAVWHWPHFLVRDSVMANNYHSFPWFVIFTLSISIIYSWLYNSTRGSLLMVSLFHASTNATNSLLFYSQEIAHSVFPYYLIITLIVLLGLVAICRDHFLSAAG